MAEASTTSRILTLVFTDLAGSTALKAERGDQAGGALIERHRAIVRRLAEQSGGRIIDWAGDGCFLAARAGVAERGARVDVASIRLRGLCTRSQACPDYPFPMSAATPPGNHRRATVAAILDRSISDMPDDIVHLARRFPDQAAMLDGSGCPC